MTTVYANPVEGEISLDISSQKAHQACLTCKKQKRKCDKELPACGLCVRMARHCDYSDPPPLPTYNDINILQSRIQELEANLHAALSDHTPQSQLGSPSSNALTIRSNTTIAQDPSKVSVDPAWSSARNRFPSIAFLDCEAFQFGGHVYLLCLAPIVETDY